MPDRHALIEIKIEICYNEFIVRCYMEKSFNKNINRTMMNSVKWIAQKHPQDLPFWVADSDYQTCDSIITELTTVAKHGVFGYTIIPEEFNKSVSAWYKKRYHQDISSHWVVPSTGVILSIRIILESISNQDDAVILQTPVYHTFFHLLEAMNRPIIHNPLINKDGIYKMDLVDLEKQFQKGSKILILCSPHNPVGRIWDEDELASVVKLANKYQVTVISDEIHSDLSPSGKPFVSMAKYAKDLPNLYICNAPSKAFNLAGLNTSYVIIPSDENRQKFSQIVNNDFLNYPCIFGTKAMIKAYHDGDAWLEAQNKHLLNNYQYVCDFFKTHFPLVVVAPLEGTYLMWFDFSKMGYNSLDLMEIFNASGVTLSLGDSFHPAHTGFMRMNIACPTHQLEEGLSRIKQALVGAKCA